MNTQPKRIEPVALENLLIDLQNPRYDPRTSQREAISTIAHEQGIKLFNLAEDIIDKGLNPSELAIVTPTDEGDKYTILEGNRRVATLKLLSSPSLLTSIGLSQGLVKRYKALYDIAKDAIPKQIDCVVLPREDANYWILLKHTGENEGIGIVSWDGRARQRFRGSSPALQAIEFVETGNYLDEETRMRLPKVAITNIERILNTPDARKHLGVDVKNDKLILKSPEEEALGRLAIFVSDVANRHITVSDIDTKDQRVSYAQDVASRPLPKSHGSGARGGTAGPASPLVFSRWGRRIGPDRKTLIPRQLKLTILQTRINRIYHELQKLHVEQFINSCAVMFRVFVELSVDDFAQRHKISLKVPVKSKPGTTTQPPMRDMHLREKIDAVVCHLETRGICNKAELRGVKALVANRDHVLSVDSLNAYVHNKDYNPTSSDLRANWDNIQIFIERIWTA